MPGRDDATQSGSTESSSQPSAAPPDTPPAGKPTVGQPTLGSIFDRIPVHNVSPVIEGGAYAAKAAVGESIPIRATVFREGHDAVNASVILTDPSGNERLEPMRPTTPVGFDWWTTSVELETEGLWTFRVEGWSDPWATWVHNAEIKIPAGIDVALVCTEGIALFDRAANEAEAAGDYQTSALLQGAAKNLDSGQQVEDRLEVVLAAEVRAAMERFGPRELISPTPDYPIFVDRRQALFSSWYEFFPRSQGARWDEESQMWISGTFRPSTRSAARFARGRTTHWLPVRAIPARHGRSGGRKVDTTPSIPTSATSTHSTGSSPKPSRSGSRSPWTSRSKHRLIIRG